MWFYGILNILNFKISCKKYLHQDQQVLSVKVQIINILGLEDHKPVTDT